MVRKKTGEEGKGRRKTITFQATAKTLDDLGLLASLIQGSEYGQVKLQGKAVTRSRVIRMGLDLMVSMMKDDPVSFWHYLGTKC